MLTRIADSRAALVAIIALGLLFRLALAARQAPKPLVSDAAMYFQIGRHIAAGHGFVSSGSAEYDPDIRRATAYGNPIYPTFLAGVMRLFGPRVLPVLVVQAFLDMLTCLLVYWMAVTLTRRRAAGVIATAIYAFYPMFALSAATVLTETLTILILTAALCACWVAIEKGMSAAIAAGALMGLCVLLKPAVLLLPVFLVPAFWLARGDGKGWLPKALVYVVASYLVVMPWTVRNYRVLHGFVPVASHGGLTLWGGTGVADGKSLVHAYMPIVPEGTRPTSDPYCRVVSKPVYEKIMRLRARLRGLDEVQQDVVYRQAAVEEIRQHPGRFAFLAVKKFSRLWFNLWHDDPPSKASLIVAFVNLCLIALAFAGCIKGCVDKRFCQVVGLFALYTTLIHMLTFSMVRYSLPVFPFIGILVAAFLTRSQKAPSNESATA